MDALEVTWKLMAKSKAQLARAAEYKVGFDFLKEDILPKLEEFLHLKQILDPETFTEGLGTSAGLLRLSQVVGELKSQSIDSASAARIMYAAVNAELLEGQARDAVLNSKIDQIQSRMGVTPEDVNTHWSSPTLWGTVSKMASFLEPSMREQGLVK
jgi:membrane-bound lytic murein transglycosylase B